MGAYTDPNAPKRFYMVLVEGQGMSPNVRHASLTLAEEEAKRLAVKQGQRAYVLGVVGACQPVENVKWFTF